MPNKIKYQQNHVPAIQAGEYRVQIGLSNEFQDWRNEVDAEGNLYYLEKNFIQLQF